MATVYWSPISRRAQAFPATALRLAGLAMAAALLLLAVSCARGGAAIDLGARPLPSQPSPASPPKKDRLVLAVAAVNSPMSTFEDYADLARYLGEKLGMEAKFIGGKTYAEINSLVRSGDATLAIVCSGAYVYGHDEFGMELLAAPVLNGQMVYYSYLIVQRDSPIDSWLHLRGRTFAFTDPLSNSGRVVPLYQLKQMGETPESFFSKYIFTYSHDNSIAAVAGKLVDAAAVDSLVYDYAVQNGSEEAGKTKVIWRSPPFGINPVVVSPMLEPVLKAKLRDVLLKMETDEDGRRMLHRLDIDRFAPIQDGAYDSIRDMMRAVQVEPVP
ncbi:MAG: phosphate/phosphite/phosphonate ABC transporter substrate-binding protein [Chloroflexi bacterium]|nr:phosphate/phosphite/phosphonate ABC transporter substrate-binding protein [Chloroflexota bacterium]